MFICPEYHHLRCAEVDLNDFFRKLQLQSTGKISALSRAYKEPDYCQSLVEQALKNCGARWGVSPPWENRDVLWAGGYPTQVGRTRHLGRDIYVRAGALVWATCPLEVLSIDSDHPEIGGWGTKIIARALGTPYKLIFAHVQPQKGVGIGTKVSTGEELAVVDGAASNGHWFPHLHVQTIAPEADAYYADRPGELDGYGSEVNLERDKQWFPDPIEIGLVRL